MTPPIEPRPVGLPCRDGVVLVPGVGGLEEGFAKKFLYDAPEVGMLRELVLCRVDGVLHALDSRCPHEGGRISEGPLRDGRHLICPLHLYRFDPRDGSAIEVDCPSATVFPIRIVDGVAEVRVAERPEES